MGTHIPEKGKLGPNSYQEESQKKGAWLKKTNQQNRFKNVHRSTIHNKQKTGHNHPNGDNQQENG